MKYSFTLYYIFLYFFNIILKQIEVFTLYILHNVIWGWSSIAIIENLNLEIVIMFFLKSYNCHSNINSPLLFWKSRVILSEISKDIYLEYAGILLQMKMRASATLILQRKASSPTMINNLNNEVWSDFNNYRVSRKKLDMCSGLILGSYIPQIKKQTTLY